MKGECVLVEIVDGPTEAEIRKSLIRGDKIKFFLEGRIPIHGIIIEIRGTNPLELKLDTGKEVKSIPWYDPDIFLGEISFA